MRRVKTKLSPDRRKTAADASGVTNPCFLRDASLPADFEDPDVHEARTEMPVTLIAAPSLILIRAKQIEQFLARPALDADPGAEIGKHRTPRVAQDFRCFPLLGIKPTRWRRSIGSAGQPSDSEEHEERGNDGTAREAMS